MPFFDRFWELRLLPVAVVLAVAAGLADRSISLNASINPGASLFSPVPIILASSGALTLLLYLVLFGSQAMRARRRTHLRRMTRRGNRDAMPLARLAPVPGRVPDLADGPLVLSWVSSVRAPRQVEPASEPDRAARRRLSRLFRVLWLILLVVIVVQWAPMLVSIFGAFPLSPGDITVALLSGALIAVPIVLVMCVLSGTFLAFITLGWSGILALLRRKPFGVTADGSGIRELTVGGRTHFVPWNDACLFEVEIGRVGGSAGYHFYLFGSRTYVHWTDELIMKRSDAVPDGISREEMTHRQEAMLDLVAARTGLTLRTATRALQQGGAAPTVRRVNLTLGLLLGLGAVVAYGLAAASLWVPLTGLLPFDAVVAGLFAIGATATASIAVPYILKSGQRRSAQALAYVPPDAPPPPAPGASYVTYTSRSRPRRWLQWLAAGAPTLGGMLGYLPLGIPYELSFLPDPFTRPSLDNTWSSMLPIGLCLAAAFGAIFLCTLYIFRETVVHADERGIRVGYGMVRSSVAWNDIEHVLVLVKGSRAQMYTLLGPNLKPVAGWFAYPSRRPRPPAGETVISPDQFAALVAAQSGRLLQVVRVGEEMSRASGMAG